MGAIQEIDIADAATLIVAWRAGRNAHGAVLRAGGQVIDAMRGYAGESLDDHYLRSRAPLQSRRRAR